MRVPTIGLAPLLGGGIGAVLGFVAGALVGLAVVLFLEVPVFGIIALFALLSLISAALKKRYKPNTCAQAAETCMPLRAMVCSELVYYE